MRIKSIVLENKTHSPLFRRYVGDIIILKEYPSACRSQKSAYQIQRSAFSAARWTEKTYKLAVWNLKVEIVNGNYIAACIFSSCRESLGRFLSTIFIHASSHRYFVYIGRTNSRRVLYYFSMLAVIFPPLSHNIRLASRIRTKKDSTAHRAMESQHQFIQLDKVALRLGVKDMNEPCVEHELDPCMSCKCIEA